MLGISLILLSGATQAETPPPISITAVLELANKLYSENKFDSARQEFERATEFDKGSLPAWRGLGWSYWALGQKQHAYQIWGDLVKAVPDDVPTLLTLGKASEQDRRWPEATAYYAQVLALQPHDQAAHQGRARVFIAQGKLQPAEQDLKAALNEMPSNNSAKSLLADALMAQGRYQEAKPLLEKLAQAEPVPINLRRLGTTLAKLGQYEQAAGYYKSSLALQADADILPAWRRLGASLRKNGQHQQAYTVWRGILQDFPNDVPTLLVLGQASEQDKLWQQSLSYYAQVLHKAPREQAAYLGRARIFAAQQDYTAAEAELKSALAQSPADTEAKFALADNLITTGRRDEAEKILHPLVDRYPEPKNMRRLGTLLADLGRDDEAAAYFLKSLQLDVGDATSVMGLTRVYWNQHRYQESIAILQNYLATHPDNDVARARLAEHASAANHWDQAERELRWLVDKHPNDSAWQVKLARQLHLEGRHAEAVQLAEQVVGKEPHQVNALKLLAESAIFSGDIDAGIRWTKQITTAAPTAERFEQLALLYLEHGEQLDSADKHDAAMQQYALSIPEFQRAEALDPIKSKAAIGRVEVLRLQKRHSEALQLAKQLHAKYPNSVELLQQLVDIYWEQGDYASARQSLALKKTLLSGNTVLDQNLAKLTFYTGDREQGLEMLDKLVAASNYPSIPVLLYHGITLSDRQDTMPLQKFKDQLRELKKAGYQSITLKQLLGFLEGNAVLPPKPLVITFDDARMDSFQYADPILEETGFKATMFVPVGDVATHGAYTAVWSTLRQMLATGRWDMQCHGTEAQHYIPVDAQNHKGRFMANKRWLSDAAHLETDQEFKARINQDLLNCQQVLERELAEHNVFAFAYPYSDQGHRSLSNAPDAFKINHELVKKNFQLAFHVDNDYPVTLNSRRFELPRFEVPRTFTGKALVHQLQMLNPEVSASYALARLEVDAGHYTRAMKIFDALEQGGVVDEADLLTVTGRVAKWSGDHGVARERFEKALALRPDAPLVQQEIAALDNRKKPAVQLSNLYFQDNAHRSYYVFNSFAQFFVSDRLSLSAYYKYLDFDQKIKASGAIPEQRFQATGNQLESRLNYELGTRSLLSLSAGFADFSGTASQDPSKSGPTFALGSAKLSTGVGDRFDLSIGIDRNYVNTAGAILNNIAFNRVMGGAKAKITDSSSVSLSHEYFDYTDHNERNRTEIELDSSVWSNPDITVGAQLVHDDTLKNSRLFWTPNNYFGLSAPLGLKKSWADDAVVATVTVAPGMGKEAGHDFKFQFNTTGTLNWNVNDDLSLNVSASRYQAATYSNFSVFAGVSLKF
jgi:tetratricopeptide (TPR) repeat protein